MNAKYLRSKATASRLIKANGAKFQMKRLVAGATPTDPVEGTVAEDVEQLQDIWAVILPPSSGRDSFLDQFKGEGGVLDLSKIKSILISTEGLLWNPEPLQRVFYRGEWWQYEMAKGLDPDGETDILFKGYLRRV
jgi:hypothetical protein